MQFLPLAKQARLLDSPALDTPKGKRDRGLRVAEVVGLPLAALDSDNDPARLVVVGKGSKRRTIYLTENVKATLQAWLPVRPSSESERLFLALGRRTHGGPLSARSARRMVDTYLAALGAKRPGISCHSLRHSFATWSVAAGAPLPASLGHASVATTGIYARVADRIKHNPTAYLEGLLETA